MTFALSKSDQALFPGIYAAANANSADLLESVKKNPSLIAQLNPDHLRLIIEHIKRFPRMSWETVLIHLSCLQQMDQWAEMVSVGSTFLHQHPSHKAVRQLRAQAYFASKNWEAFIHECNIVMDEHRPDFCLLTQRCYAYYKNRQLCEMLQDVRKIVEISSSDPEHSIEQDLDPTNPAACLRAYAVLSHYFPKDPELFRCQGRLLFYSHQWDKLLKNCWLWQIAISPQTDREMVYLKIHACICLHQWNIVIDETTQILQQTPDDVALLGLRAKALACQGDLLNSLKDNFMRCVHISEKLSKMPSKVTAQGLNL